MIHYIAGGGSAVYANSYRYIVVQRLNEEVLVWKTRSGRKNKVQGINALQAAREKMMQ